MAEHLMVLNMELDVSRLDTRYVCQHPALNTRSSQGMDQLTTHKTASKSTPNSNSIPILMDAVTSFG